MRTLIMGLLAIAGPALAFGGAPAAASDGGFSNRIDNIYGDGPADYYYYGDYDGPRVYGYYSGPRVYGYYSGPRVRSYSAYGPRVYGYRARRDFDGPRVRYDSNAGHCGTFHYWRDGRCIDKRYER